MVSAQVFNSCTTDWMWSRTYKGGAGAGCPCKTRSLPAPLHSWPRGGTIAMTFDTEGAQPPTMLTGPTATLELMRGVSDAVAIKDQTLAGGLSPPAGCPHEVSLGGLLRALGSLIDNVRDNRRLCEEQRMAGIDLGHRGTDALGHVLERLLGRRPCPDERSRPS